MKKFLKALAILILAAHLFAGLIYIGIIPIQLFTNLRLPEAGRFAEFILRINGSEEEKEAAEPQTEGQAEMPEETSAAGESAVPDKEDESAEEETEEKKGARIELSEPLPALTEEDLYDLSQVLINAGALKAVDARGEDLSDQVICELAADINNPGHFTAVFSVKLDDGQIQRGPSADMQVEMTAPFLAFREDNLTIPVGTDYDPHRNILICMDIDGTVLTDFAEYDGFLDASQAGDYELRFFIYSRVTASSAFRTMRIHVE